MSKTILVTGATDGIGLETAKQFGSQGHHVLLHGRNRHKLDAARSAVGGETSAYIADFSNLTAVEEMAETISNEHEKLDVLINNAGIFNTPNPVTNDGQDIRFVVNMFAPYLLTTKLLSSMPTDGRVINLSSAAQAPVNISALRGGIQLDDMTAYAQSKLAITMWSRDIAKTYPDGPIIMSVNPGSLLASKMVKEGFGVPGNDLGIGVEILRRASLDNDFSSASGRYFDNDAGRFSDPHPDALNDKKVKEVVSAVEETVSNLIGK